MDGASRAYLATFMHFYVLPTLFVYFLECHLYNYIFISIGTTSESAGEQESVAKKTSQVSGCRGGRYLPVCSPSGIPKKLVKWYTMYTLFACSSDCNAYDAVSQSHSM